MRIQFVKPDPRAGMVAEVQGSTGKRHIANGAAVEVAKTTEGAQPAPSSEKKAVVRSAVKAAKTKAAKKPAAKKAK